MCVDGEVEGLVLAVLRCLLLTACCSCRIQVLPSFTGVAYLDVVGGI